jgi:hypothetical protein
MAMSRSFGLPLLLVALLIGGYLFVAQNKSNGPSSAVVTQAETQAESFTAATNFQAADQVMQASYAENGTYVGAAMAPGSGVTLVRADATSYCLESVNGTAVEHETGPGGQAQPGPC